MLAWRPVSLVTPSGRLRSPGHVADEIRSADSPGGVLLTGPPFGRLAAHARLLCHHLGRLGRPWAIEGALEAGRQLELLRLARQSGCRGLVIGPDPDPLTLGAADEPDRLRAAAADLRRIRRAGLSTVLRCTLGRDGHDAGVFARAVWLCTAGRVAFPQLVAHRGDLGMSGADLHQGLEWAERALHTRWAIWRRTGVVGSRRLGTLLANMRTRRRILARPPVGATPAMRLARALARPIRIRERVPFVSTLVGAVQASGEQVRSAWLRTRAVRDETLAALVIRLEGAIDARAARTLVTRVRRALGSTPERIVIDLGGLERVSLTVLTRFLEEHASRLLELRGRLAFRHLRPALAAVRSNLHGMLPNAALLEHALEEAR
jgi:anti-anti-sigma regulatory factor